MERNTRLSPHFTLGEFVMDGDRPGEEVLRNLHLLAQRLQVVRDLLNRPVHINSGYRNPEHNAAVGGARNSYHLLGMAADVVIAGMPARAVQAFLKHWSGGLGAYAGFTHLDIRPERARWS
ncbi:MAG: YcbK family protein [Candidatus Melainabacteria bacterium]